MKRRDFLKTIPPALMLPMPAMSHPTDAGRPWHATLRDLVEAARSGRVAHQQFVSLDGQGPPIVTCAIPLDVTSRMAIFPLRKSIDLIGKLNRDRFCGAGPGELMFSGCETDRGVGEFLVTYRFDLKLDHRWDEYLDESSRWLPLRGADGRPVYDAADFAEIP